MRAEPVRTVMVPAGRLRPGMPLGQMVVLPDLTSATLGTPLTRDEIDALERSGTAAAPILHGPGAGEYDSPIARARAELGFAQE